MKKSKSLSKLNHSVYTNPFPSPLYSIEIHRRRITKKDIMAIDNALRRYREKYLFCSFLRVVSTTDAKTAKRTVIKNNKRGRPRIMVDGEPVPLHVHIAVISTDPGRKAYKYASEICAFINAKLFNEPKDSRKYVQIREKKSPGHFIAYCLKQADSPRRTGGEFPFIQYEEQEISN